MTPTQPSQAVEAAVERIMQLADNFATIKFVEGADGCEALVDDARENLERVVRAELARPQDFDTWQDNPYTKVLQKSIAEDYVPKFDRPLKVAAPVGDVPAGLIACLRGGRQCDEDGSEIIMSRQACCEAADILERLAASRVPVALPASRMTWLPSMRDMNLQEPKTKDYGHGYQHGFTSGWNDCLQRIQEEWGRTTPAPKQGDAKDARPDSFHSGSGECDRVQRVELSGDELALFQRTLDDFADCGETETDYEVLVNWARRGLLECTNFRPTAAAHRMLASSTSTDQKGNAA